MASACLFFCFPRDWSITLIISLRRIRLYSTKTCKPLGTLRYHKQSVQALAFFSPSAFSHPISSSERMRGGGGQEGGQEGEGAGEDEDGMEMTKAEKAERARWLLGGGKDGRVSIWTLIDFERRK